MTTQLTKIPNTVAIGAQLTFMVSTAKNMSESGNTSRKSLRPIKRNYMVSISPDDSDEMQEIIMALDGDRFPMAMRDYAAYQVVDEVCAIDETTGDFLMGRTWAPSTGSLTKFERILIPDSDMVVKLNGSAATTGSFTIEDFGRIRPTSFSTSDEWSISGSYLKPVCLIDAPSANLFGSIGGVVQYQFDQMRFEEIYEAELIDLVAGMT